MVNCRSTNRFSWIVRAFYSPKEKFRMKKDGVILVLIVVVVVDDFSAEPFTIGVTQRIYIYIFKIFSKTK